MAVTVTFADSGFPSTTFSGDLQDLIDAFVAHLSATIPTNNVLVGQYNGIEPFSDIGPWMDNRTWKAWDGSGYAPALIQIGDDTHVITLSASPSADRTVTFQDKTGIVALTTDVFSPRNSINLATTTPAHKIDWSASASFYESTTADTTYTQVNSLPGQKIAVQISMTLTHNVTFPATILWAGGGGPTFSIAAKKDLFLLENIAGTIYGERIQDFN